MKNLIYLLALSSLSAFAHADVSCSDATGSTRYVETAYRGGPAPRPGMQIGDVQIYVNNTLESEQKTLAGNPAVQVPAIARLLASFDKSVEHEMPGFNGQPTTQRSFATLMTISANPLAPGPSPLPVSVYVICNEVHYFYP